MSVKFLARIPTVEYGYIEVESDNFAEFTDAIISAEDHVKNAPATTGQAVQNLTDAGLIPATPQPVAPQQAQQPAQGWQPTAPQANPAQAPAPRCAHGERKYVAKANWKAWMCPQPKDAADKCSPEWIN